MTIQWTSDLAVGVPKVDAQHQQLFGLVNDLLAAMRQGQGRAELSRVLAFLEAYVIEHFGDEEQTMLAHQYPGYAAHKVEHDRFVRDVKKLKARMEAEGASTALVIDVNDRVCKWLVEHISRSDKAIGSFIASRAKAARTS
jgi:hemerythrin